jgi:hypothetical protein
MGLFAHDHYGTLSKVLVDLVHRQLERLQFFHITHSCLFLIGDVSVYL